MADTWSNAQEYEQYVGRWSRPVAVRFLDWLGLPPGRDCLEVGCGTGALTECERVRVRDRRVTFHEAGGERLPAADRSADAAISGLAINFIPQAGAALAEQVRVLRPGGVAAAYVWDYAGRMELMRRFWDAAVALDPAAQPKDEGVRFPLARSAALGDLWRGAGLRQVEVMDIAVPTVFRDFDDYWQPFLGRQGPAPGYCMSLDEERRAALRERLRATLPIQADGSIPLIARALAVKGRRP